MNAYLLNQLGLILNVIGSIFIAISIAEKEANVYLCGKDNKPIKPLVIKNRLLYVGLGLLITGFILSFIATFIK